MRMNAHLVLDDPRPEELTVKEVAERMFPDAANERAHFIKMWTMFAADHGLQDEKLLLISAAWWNKRRSFCLTSPVSVSSITRFNTSGIKLVLFDGQGKNETDTCARGQFEELIPTPGIGVNPLPTIIPVSRAQAFLDDVGDRRPSDKVDLEDVPTGILVDAAQNIGWETDAEHPKRADVPAEYLEELRRMTGVELFSAYCDWNGLVRWGKTLWGYVEELQAAEVV